MATIIGLIACFYAQNMGNKPEEGYRIEVAKETVQTASYVKTKEKEIRFISPEGKVLKILPYDTWEEKSKIILSPNLRYLIKKDEIVRLSEEEVKKAQEREELFSSRLSLLKFHFINAMGKVKWSKEFVIEGVGDEVFCPYFLSISGDGSRIVFSKNHSISYYKDKCLIVVYDTLGNEVISFWLNHYVESKPEISQDGKIVGAEVYFPPEGSNTSMTVKHLFFLDVETGRTKFVKAEGKGWRGYFILSSTPFPPQNKQVRLGWQPLDKKYDKIPGGGVKTRDIAFDEIPDDLSTLFEQGGER